MCYGTYHRWLWYFRLLLERKMILVDLSQVLFSNLFANLGSLAYNSPNDGKEPPEPPFNEDLIRHMVLNSLRFYRSKFKDKYVKLVIACDNSPYWRKDVFPFYKSGRKKARDNSPLDWKLIFQSLNKIRDELGIYLEIEKSTSNQVDY